MVPLRPIKSGRIVCFGGFPMDIEAEIVMTKLNEIQTMNTGAIQAMVPGRFVPKGKILFSSNGTAWELMKKMKGKKFSVEVNGTNTSLWHGFDKISE